LARKKIPFLPFLTDGQSNRIIDVVFHPRAKRDARYWLADWVAHAIIERDPVLSAKKFIRYTAPKVAKQYLKGKVAKKRRRRRTQY